MTIRRAGGWWRLLVHEYAGRPPGWDRGVYSVSHDVTNVPGVAKRHPDSEHQRTHLLPPNTEFDELVVGSWLHVEQMDVGHWWMSIGGVVINVTADRDGRPQRVDVYGPGTYDHPREGVDYQLTWKHEEEPDVR